MAKSNDGTTETVTEGVTVATPGGAASQLPGMATATASPEVEGERPAWLPEEFKTVDDFITDYNSKRPAAMDKGTAPAPASEDGADTTTTAETQTEAAPERTDDEIRASLKAAGGVYANPAYEPAALEFERTGDVSDATLSTVAAALGVPEDFAREFVNTQKQLRTLAAAGIADATAKAVEAVESIVGGKDEYAKFMEWANDGGLTPAQREAYNKALNTDHTVAQTMLAGFNQAYRAAGHGAAPRDITEAGGGLPSGAAQVAEGYASSAEMQKDMADPRYRKDEAFRRQVARKVDASKF